MRRLRRICPLLLLAVGCSANTDLRPFTTDGCSLFPDGTRQDRQLWHDCCVAHDRAYWQGGTRVARLRADRALKACVEAVGRPKTAKFMLAGVRVGGSPYVPTPFRWAYGWPYGRGYKALSRREKEEAARLMGAAMPVTTAQQAARMAAALERWQAFGFSGAVLVAEGGNVTSASGYGLADRAHGKAVTRRTVFDIGSVAKQFTAAAVLKLAEQGRLVVADSIAAVLPDVPPDKRGITVHHLLTHTSGLDDFGKDTELVGRDELVQQILAHPFAQPPGAAYQYSNLGYALLAAIVEHAAGASFETYLDRHLFTPAGMTDTGFSWAPPAAAAERLALGYGGFNAPCAGEDPRRRTLGWRSRGSGSVLSTVDDLFAWERALTAGKILGAEARAQMFTAHTRAEADFLSYGYGWRLQETPRGTRLAWHSGLEGAYSAMVRRYTDEDVVLIFLSNLSIGGVPLREILVPPARTGPLAAYLFDPAASPALPPATVAAVANVQAAFEGVYDVAANGRWIVERDGSALTLRAEGQAAIDALFPPASAEVEERYVSGTAYARRMAEALASKVARSLPALQHLDPLGYAERDAAAVRAIWQHYGERLGPLHAIETLGTTSMRARRGAKMVTFLRLRFAEGEVDEHLIHFAEDERYLLPCRPATFSLRLASRPDGGLVGFDLLSGRTFAARLADGGKTLVLTVDGEQVRASRSQRS